MIRAKVRHESSLLDIALRRAVHDSLLADERWGHLLAVYADGMQRNDYDEHLLEAVAQTPVRAFTIYDAFCFASIHSDISEGRIIVATTPIGTRAYPDRLKKAINEALSGLESPFYADFKGDNDDADGIFGWRDRLDFNLEGRNLCVDPDMLPLEVGYTSAVNTWNHIQLRGGLARWPYGREEITFLIAVARNSNDPKESQT